MFGFGSWGGGGSISTPAETPTLEAVVLKGNTVNEKEIVLNENEYRALLSALQLVLSNKSDSIIAGFHSNNFFINNTETGENITVDLVGISRLRSGILKEFIFGSASEPRTIELPNKSGMVALLSDVAGTEVVLPATVSASNVAVFSKLALQSIPYQDISIDGALLNYKGAWIASFPAQLTSYTEDISDFVCNIAGINGAFNLSALKFKNLPSFPNLKAVMNTFTGITGAYLTVPFNYDAIFPKLEYVVTFSPNFVVTGVVNPTFTALKYVVATISSLFTTGYSGIIYFPNLESISTLNINNTFMSFCSGVSMPKLKYIQTLAIAANTLTTTWDFSSLEYAGSINLSLSNLSGATSLDFPSLKYTNSLTTTSATLPTVITFPNMVVWNTVYTATNVQISSATGNIQQVVLGTIGTLKAINGSVIITGQALTQSCVNAILALLVSLDGTNGTTLFGTGKTVNLSGGTSSAPSAVGLANKAILQSRGVTVTHN